MLGLKRQCQCHNHRYADGLARIAKDVDFAILSKLFDTPVDSLIDEDVDATRLRPGYKFGSIQRWWDKFFEPKPATIQMSIPL